MQNLPLKSLLLLIIVVTLAGLYYKNYTNANQSHLIEESMKEEEDHNVPEKLELTEQEWKERLTPEQYRVLRTKGTEPAYSGSLWDNKEEGVYQCAACELPLYSSETKFESGTGWPSFYEPINKNNVIYKEDNTLFTTRTEVLCARCQSHIGHVFEDGPPPTGLRYCMNSIALHFVRAQKRG